MKIDVLLQEMVKTPKGAAIISASVKAPTSQQRHESVVSLAQHMPIAEAHQTEGLCWRVSKQRFGYVNLGMYLQLIHRIKSNVQRHPELTTQYGSANLVFLDHKTLNMGNTSEFERLTDATLKVDKALQNLEIDFDTTKFKKVVRCRYCGSGDFMKITHLQTRSADEGMTEFKECTSCQERWV